VKVVAAVMQKAMDEVCWDSIGDRIGNSIEIVLETQWQHCSSRWSSAATVLPLCLQYDLKHWRLTKTRK
jgi:hypothetical protein